MELSKRLYAVAGLVTEGASVADVGTDHGYIPIYLVNIRLLLRLSPLILTRVLFSVQDFTLSGMDLRTRLRQGCRTV